MNNMITIMDSIYITISSMTIVFLILLLISLVLASFKYIFKENPKVQDSKIIDNNNLVNYENEEEKLVACLAASIMAGDGKINPNLHIRRVTRIK